jgi:hypothetical protein
MTKVNEINRKYNKNKVSLSLMVSVPFRGCCEQVIHMQLTSTKVVVKHCLMY